MRKSFNLLTASLTCGIAACFIPSPAMATTIKAQGPCTYIQGACTKFDFNDPVPVVATFTFNMPAAGGAALVRFDGTMQCEVNTSAGNADVVDLSGQIVTLANAVADYSGPGGNRFIMRLHYGNTNSTSPSTTVNLAATRTVKYSGGGAKTVYYKFTKTRMDNETLCRVHAASFTIVITP